jgi:hypothetical protein
MLDGKSGEGEMKTGDDDDELDYVRWRQHDEDAPNTSQVSDNLAWSHASSTNTTA